MTLSFSNFMEWFPFAFIIVGGALALLTPFLKSGNQRRDKTTQLLATFTASLHKNDIELWKEIYHGTREAASAPAGYFISRIGKPVPLVSMWADDSENNRAIQRLAESLETVCAEILAHTVDSKIVCAEIGQLMETMHDWLESIPGMQQDLSFLEEQYPALKQVFEKYGSGFKKWPCRVYAKR